MTDEPENSDDLIWRAMERADEAESRGDLVEALHALRAAPRGPTMPEVSRADGNMEMKMPVVSLALHARKNLLSLRLGQWGDSPRHDPSSDTPHGWVTMYEWLNPRLPEASPLLRLWMDRLRVQISYDHENYGKAAAWALDQLRFVEENESFWTSEKARRNVRAEAQVNLAVAMSHLGFKATARSLYQQLLSEYDADDTNRAAFQISFGDHLWGAGDRASAEALYSESIEVYRRAGNPTLIDMHNLIRSYARRADCYLQREHGDAAFADVQAAFDVLDVSRQRGAYESVRSVDVAVKDDIANLVDYLTRLPVSTERLHGFTAALARLGNSSYASWLRRDEFRDGGRREVYVGDSRNRLAREWNVRAAQRWHPITDEEVDSLLGSDEPLVMCALSFTSRERIGGLTLVAGGGRPATGRTWELTAGRDANELRLLRDLIAPPPGAALPESGPWAQSWSEDLIGPLARRMVPIDDLSERLSGSGFRSLRFVPAGRMWRFPFACLPIDGRPLGTLVPTVVTPGPTINVGRPVEQRWIGHFDLSLPNALADLGAAMAAARDSGAGLELFDDLEQLREPPGVKPATLLVFSAHGRVEADSERLLLAGGRPVSAAEFDGCLAKGATVVLNACWSGYVHDRYGQDTAQQALEFLAVGAHSVLGTVGPVSDRSASNFLRECLPELAAGRPLAHACRAAVARLWQRDPTLPLASWASHVTIGRNTDFTTDGEHHIEH